MSDDFITEQVHSARVAVEAERGLWCVVLYSEAIGDGGPMHMGLYVSRSVAELFAERLSALISGQAMPSWTERAVEVKRDAVARFEHELALYAQTWAEWDRYFDDEERAEIRADESLVTLGLLNAREELEAWLRLDGAETAEIEP